MSQLLALRAREPQPLPYFCDPKKLPEGEALPTLSEIESATTTLPTVFGRDDRRVVSIRDCFVVKYGAWVQENEGQALLFMENYPSIPVPRLYAMYRNNEKLYLVMSYMPGTQLSSVWASLSEDEKVSLTQQLRGIWDTLRSIPPSPSRFTFSNISGGPLQHRFFLVLDQDPRITGPFESKEALGQALALHSHQNWEASVQRAWTSEFFERHLPTALSRHDAMLTHGDLQRKNILVEQDPTQLLGTPLHSGRSFRVTAVLDWEDAGWYPSYWEYASNYVDFQWRDDWPEKIEGILDVYPLESALLKIVRIDLDF